VTSIAAFFADILMKGVVIIVLALIAARVAGGHNARVVIIWRTAFAALIALPFLSLLLPSFSFALIDVNHDALNSTLAANGSGLSLLSLVFFVWSIGGLVGLVRLARDVSAARRLAAEAVTTIDRRVATLFEKALAIVKVPRRPELRETTALGTAALIGWRRPIVLLPSESHSWSDDELLGVLCHELEHLRHGDWLLLILERITTAVFWLNPLVHFAFRASSVAREIVADDAVIRSSVSLQEYAARLIASARSGSAAPAMASISLVGNGVTALRVKALFEPGRHRRSVSRRGRLLFMTATLPVLLTLVSAEPWRCVPGASASPSTAKCP
jgi:beta-lactamase regulating signal transducer with metallopeptidase domain